MANRLLATLFINAVVFSVLLLLLLPLRRLLGKRLSPAVQLLLWAVVALKLIIPFGFESNLSLLPAQTVSALMQQSSGLSVIPPVTGQPASTQQALESESTLTGSAAPVSANQTVQDISSNLTKTAKHPLDLSLLLVGFWAAGVLVVTAVLWIGAANLRRRVRHGRTDEPAHVLAAFEQCRCELGIQRGVRLVMSQAAGVPIVMGAAKPTLVLPLDTGRLDDQALRHVLLHELTHIRRADLWVLRLMNALCAVYWFAPTVWLGSRLVCADIEIACDHGVLRAIGSGQRLGYISTVLQFTGRRQTSGRLVAAMGLSDGRLEMEKRIAGMYRSTRTDVKSRIVAAAAALLLLSTSMLTACQPTPDDAIVVNKANDTLENRIKAAPARESRYTAPDRWQASAESPSGAIKVVVDAAVQIPDVTAYPVVSIMPADISQDLADNYIKSLLGDKQLYQYQQFKDLTKAEIGKKILSAQQSLSDTDPDLMAIKENDPENYKLAIESRKETLSAWEDQLASAPDSIARQPVDSRFTSSDSSGNFWQQFGNIFAGNQTLSVEADTGKSKPSSLQIYKDRSNKRNELHYNNFEEADKTSSGSVFFEINSDLPGQKMSLSEARTAATQFLAKMGITGMTIAVNASRAYEGKVTDIEKPLSSYPRFYEFIFTRGAGKVPLVYVNNHLFTMGLDQYEMQWQEERATVDLDDSGVLAWDWTAPAKVLCTENTNVALLPIEDIQKKFIRQVLISGAWRADDDSVVSREIHIEKVTLGIARIPRKNNSNEYLLVPSWDFFGYSVIKYKQGAGDPAYVNENNEETERQFGHSYLTLNAIDGSVIYRNR